MVPCSIEASKAAVPIRSSGTASRRTRFRFGTELIIQGYQSKSFEHKGVGVNMNFPDGRKFLFGGSAPGAQGEVATPTKDEIAPVDKGDSPKTDDSSNKK